VDYILNELKTINHIMRAKIYYKEIKVIYFGITSSVYGFKIVFWFIININHVCYIQTKKPDIDLK